MSLVGFAHKGGMRRSGLRNKCDRGPRKAFVVGGGAVRMIPQGNLATIGRSEYCRTRPYIRKRPTSRLMRGSVIERRRKSQDEHIAVSRGSDNAVVHSRAVVGGQKYGFPSSRFPPTRRLRRPPPTQTSRASVAVHGGHGRRRLFTPPLTEMRAWQGEQDSGL